MSNHAPNLTWLRSFEAAARTLSFTEAARELGMTQTAVSLHIRSLEARLGCQLFVRNARHLSLSAMGNAYQHSVSEALANINLATANLFGSLSRETITVRAPISTAALWLAPLLPQFTNAHPEINVRLISTIWAASVSDEEVDIDIRQSIGHWPGLQVEQLSTETIVPVQSSSTDAIHVTDPGFRDVPLVQILGYENMWNLYLAAHEIQPRDPNPALIVDTTPVAIALVSSGGGHAAIQTRFARTAISTGAKIRIVGPPVAIDQSHYLVSGHTNRAQKPGAEIFRNWLRSLFSEDEFNPK